MRGRLSCLTHVLVLLPLFAYASVRAETPAASIEILSDSCGGKRLATPLGGALQLFSAFNASKDHFGVDFASKDQPVLAVAPGTVETVGWNLRSLPTANARSGLRVRGWGQYVILRHEDGSRSLYAHLEKDSTSKLKPGQLVSTGDLLAKSDTSGGASGPHLHFEYAPNGKIFSNVSKLDPWLCIAQQGELKAESRKPKAESYPFAAKAIFQVYVSNQYVGDITPDNKSRLSLLLKPGKYKVRVFAKSMVYRKAYFSIEFGEPFSVLNDAYEEMAPLMAAEIAQGETFEGILRVK